MGKVYLLFKTLNTSHFNSIWSCQVHQPKDYSVLELSFWASAESADWWHFPAVASKTS